MTYLTDKLSKITTDYLTFAGANKLKEDNGGLVPYWMISRAFNLFSNEDDFLPEDLPQAVVLTLQKVGHTDGIEVIRLPDNKSKVRYFHPDAIRTAIKSIDYAVEAQITPGIRSSVIVWERPFESGVPQARFLTDREGFAGPQADLRLVVREGKSFEDNGAFCPIVYFVDIWDEIGEDGKKLERHFHFWTPEHKYETKIPLYF